MTTYLTNLASGGYHDKPESLVFYPAAELGEEYFIAARTLLTSWCGAAAGEYDDLCVDHAVPPPCYLPSAGLPE